MKNIFVAYTMYYFTTILCSTSQLCTHYFFSNLFLFFILKFGGGGQVEQTISFFLMWFFPNIFRYLVYNLQGNIPLVKNMYSSSVGELKTRQNSLQVLQGEKKYCAEKTRRSRLQGE